MYTLKCCRLSTLAIIGLLIGNVEFLNGMNGQRLLKDQQEVSYFPVVDNDDAQEAIVAVESSFQKQKNKYRSALRKGAPVVIGLTVAGVSLVGGYYMFSQIDQGCSKMNTACGQCTDKLDQAEDNMKSISNVVMLMKQMLENCPNGANELAQGFRNFLIECCNKDEQ